MLLYISQQPYSPRQPAPWVGMVANEPQVGNPDSSCNHTRLVTNGNMSATHSSTRQSIIAFSKLLATVPTTLAFATTTVQYKQCVYCTISILHTWTYQYLFNNLRHLLPAIIHICMYVASHLFVTFHLQQTTGKKSILSPESNDHNPNMKHVSCPLRPPWLRPSPAYIAFVHSAINARATSKQQAPILPWPQRHAVWHDGRSNRCSRGWLSLFGNGCRVVIAAVSAHMLLSHYSPLFTVVMLQ